MAGGVIVAGELWIPGQKLISIPSEKRFWGPPINAFFRLDGNTIEYIGPPDQFVSIKELHGWLMEKDPLLLMTKVGQPAAEHIVDLSRGYHVDMPEHLTGGTLMQDSQRHEADQGHEEKEIWSAWGKSTDDDLYCDKQYMSRGEYRYQERMKKAAPHRGYKHPS